MIKMILKDEIIYPIIARKQRMDLFSVNDDEHEKKPKARQRQVK